MLEETTQILREHKTLLESQGEEILAHGQTLREHEAAIKGLTVYSETCMRDRRRHDDKLEEYRLNQLKLQEMQQMMAKNMQDMQDMHRAEMQEMQETHRAEMREIKETQKTMCTNIAEQTKYTKVIADIFTTGTTLKKILIGGAAIVVSLGTILGGIIFAVSWLLTVPIPT